MASVHFQGKPFNMTVIQVYVPSTDAGEAEVDQFSEDLQHHLRLTPKKGVLFIIEGWNVKGKSQEIPGITGKFGLGVQKQGKDYSLPREHSGHSKHSLPTT